MESLQTPWFYAIWTAASYLVGSLVVGDLICRVKGIDIRTLGTGNPGAANIWREVGPRYGVMVFALDIVKGVAATLPLYILDMPTWFITVAMLCLLAGQFFPLFFGFDGNTGMAAMFGATAGLIPLGVAIAAPVALGKFAITRNVGWSGGVFFATAWVAGGLLHDTLNILHGSWWAVGAAILGGVLVFGKQVVQYKWMRGGSPTAISREAIDEKRKRSAEENS
ncbi:MAG: glycerol-3-phosphate acyltransferase [Dehalococcoidia bacterium]|nr:glycerol-3-phosphate acyltransferase [Dehalococcoidia bacterium]